MHIYIYIEKGKRKSLGKSIVVNDVEIEELEDGEMCKYLGMDEDVGYDGPLNKDRISKEFIHRAKKIWNSELHSRNKVTAFNAFALPVLTMSVGILDWTEQEILKLDIKTRKVMCMSGSLHCKGDIDRLYVSRNKGGRGLNNVSDIFKTRMVKLSDHFGQLDEKNPLLSMVRDRERENIIRIGDSIRQRYASDDHHGTD